MREKFRMLSTVEVPHKNDRNLGRELVFEFARQMLPDEEEAVYRICSRRGAYGRFKDFLNRRNLLEQFAQLPARNIARYFRQGRPSLLL